MIYLINKLHDEHKSKKKTKKKHSVVKDTAYLPFACVQAIEDLKKKKGSSEAAP